MPYNYTGKYALVRRDIGMSPLPHTIHIWNSVVLNAMLFFYVTALHPNKITSYLVSSMQGTTIRNIVSVHVINSLYILGNNSRFRLINLEENKTTIFFIFHFLSKFISLSLSLSLYLSLFKVHLYNYQLPHLTL